MIMLFSLYFTDDKPQDLADRLQQLGLKDDVEKKIKSKSKKTSTEKYSRGN